MADVPRLSLPNQDNDGWVSPQDDPITPVSPRPECPVDENQVVSPRTVRVAVDFKVSNDQTMSVQVPEHVQCSMTRRPVRLRCPHCGERVTTKVVTKFDRRACLAIYLYSITCLCCLLPGVWKDLKDDIHYCPQCHKEIARCPLPRRLCCAGEGAQW